VTATVVRVRGEARDRGRAVGAALAEPIHGSLAFYRRILERRGMGPDDLQRLLTPYREAWAGALPHLLAEVDGIVEGAEAPWWEVFAVNAFEELEAMFPEPAAIDRCTAFAVSGPGGTVLAHNEQWYAGDAGNVAVIVAEPDEGPAFASPTVVACLPAVGMNASGMAQGVTSLSHRHDGEGVPRVPVSRHALQATDPEDAHRRVTLPRRSGGYGYVVAEAGGWTSTFETTATAVAQLRGDASHTNHYLAPPLAEGGDVSAGSVSRLERLRELLAERDPRTPEDAMAILRDHEGEPQAICVHPEPDDEESAAIVFSMVCHLESRRMWVAAGQPCVEPFDEIPLPEVA
jgi:isopenicillin-N N-acyltransferase like protein